ncbi:Conserved_hypothetical protein [Hexamita inflata]|uniref:IQ motif and ubiquitin-like domain-containing protein n=1 Tax=Hexamita inflata TaxID=28002 RepID=A0AA86V1Q2_9EUKA|nr:Conserved hypothetical protein [Hexamita inflata]
MSDSENMEVLPPDPEYHQTENEFELQNPKHKVSHSAQPAAHVPLVQQPLVPERSLLCKHYVAPQENCYESAVQTLQCRVFNRTKNIIAAQNNNPLYERKKCSFETQTVHFRQEFAQTSREAYTQPYNPILYGSDKTQGEYTMTGRASRYVQSEVFLERKLRAVILIQSMIRKYNAIELVDEVRAKKQQHEFDADQLKSKREQEIELEKQLQLQRRVQPKTKADFNLLQLEIETWVRQQKFSIQQANLPPEARQAALELLVEKQSKLIANVDSLRRTAQILQKNDKIVSFFRKTAEPRQWQMSDGSFCSVHTPYTMRASVLRDIYYGLEENRDLDQRLDLLLQTKYVLKEFDCELTRDTIRLIDEEADLLSRNRPQSSFIGLRKRIQNNFLQFCECPEFNPAVAVVINKEELIFRPNTLPIVEKMNKIKREAIGRLKNFQQKKAVYGQMDLFKRQFGILGLTGALRTEINEQLENGETENVEINNDEEIQVEIVGAFAMVVDQKRFDEDGIIFQLEIVGKNEEGVQYKLIGEKGKVWAERE